MFDFCHLHSEEMHEVKRCANTLQLGYTDQSALLVWEGRKDERIALKSAVH